jgi:hypothetical protein
VLYASENGLVIVDWLGAHLATNQLMERDIWLANYSPTTIHAARQNTKYIGFTGNGTGFVFDQQKKELGFVDLINTFTSPAVTIDFATGDAIVFNSQTAYRWDDITQPQMPYRWRSKVYFLPNPVSFGACRVDMDNTQAAAVGPNNLIQDALLPAGVPLRLRIYAADITGVMQTMLDVNLTQSAEFSLPSGFKSDTWQFEFIGQVTLRDFKIAETWREMAKI